MRPSILLLAGFGDGSEMFANLLSTPLALRFNLKPVDLPGFGGTPKLAGKTSLAALADFVCETVEQVDARILIAHSASSIIASLVAIKKPIETILSIEGNITLDDAYFSGMAADFDDPFVFKDAFLSRLKNLSETNPIYRRYYGMVRLADAAALWELGCDVKRLSGTQMPGELLARAAKVHYFFNPGNCPASTIEWLRGGHVNPIEMKSASHWMSVDQPNELAEQIIRALDIV